ncbi:MAG: AAA family ATPase [Desulfomonilaceae bacterium]
MLIEFSVGNYKSFREKVTFSMVAAAIKSKDKSLDANNTISAAQNLKLLTSAAIYGPNAGGKSNLVSALNFMNRFVKSSAKDTQVSEKIPVDRFRLSTEFEDQPSHFEIIFLIEGKRYRYGFELNTDRIISEWLYFAPKSREALLFERNRDNIKIGNYFKEGRGIEERTRENALFLSVAAQWNGHTSAKILSWFNKLLTLLDIPPTLPRFILEDAKFKSPILQFISALDIGITDFVSERSPIPDSSSSVQKPPKSIRQEVGSEEMDFGKFIMDEIRTKHLKYDREGKAVDQVEFLLRDNESHGTQRLFGLAPFIILALNVGLVLVIDELDTKLHPILTQSILNLFNNKETNPKNAQLIFTTHDINLLNRDLLRRDQIWFVEKDKQAATYLYSLAEFKVRNDASFDSDYVHGKYGAIPLIGNLEYPFEDRGN